MNPRILFPESLRVSCLAGLLAGVLSVVGVATAAAPQDAGGPGDPGVFVAQEPMQLVAEGTGVHGQLVVGREILGAPSGDDLVYTITAEPSYGRVGLAGGESEDFFENKRGRLGYFAYRPFEEYVGPDSFSYKVVNQTSGLVFQGRVEIDVKPPAALTLDELVVTEARDRIIAEHPVVLTIRPNTSVTQKLPSHEDFMKAEDRATIADPKVAYLLDTGARPQNGTASLDRVSGQLTYAPNPGFIGEDRFGYYTFDENNTQLGVENVIVVNVEPIRDLKRVSVDRSRSREVDLVFVINNSPSMAPHQSRIADNLRRFRELFDQRDLDYRIGVLTTDFVEASGGGRYGSSGEYKRVRSVEIDASGQPVLDRRGRARTTTKEVASNGRLVTLPVIPQPWVTPKTPDGVFAELVKVGTNGDSNRTAFTSVYNFVADFYNKQHAMLRADAPTVVVYFMDEEETRMATWQEFPGGGRQAKWVENGTLPELLKQYNDRNPGDRQTLDGYINYWVLRPFIIVKGNQRGKIEMHAVVSPGNVSHRRAAELTGGEVLNIEGDFSQELAALGARIAETVAVALDPVPAGATLYRKSIRVLVDGKEVAQDPENGWVYDERAHAIRLVGAAREKAFTAKIEITYEEHR